MKTWFWLLLTVVMLTVGCASGYSAQRSAYPAETTTYRDTGMFQNPETDSERDSRIGREESGR